MYYKRKRASRATFKRGRRSYKKRRLTLYKKPNLPFRRLRGLNPPMTEYATLKYASILNITSTGAGAANIFRGNSIWDPDQTNATGISAAKIALFSSQYLTYEVISSRIICTFENNSASGLWCFIFPYYQSAVTPVGLDNFLSQPGVKKTWVEGQGNGGRSIARLSYSINTRTILGITSSYDLQSVFTANPGNQWFWQVAILTMDGTLVPASITTVEIYYNCLFSQRKTLL